MKNVSPRGDPASRPTLRAVKRAERIPDTGRQVAAAASEKSSGGKSTWRTELVNQVRFSRRPTSHIMEADSRASEDEVRSIVEPLPVDLKEPRPVRRRLKSLPAQA